MAIDKTKTLEALVYAPLGVPTLPSIAPMDESSDILPALIKYYTHVPITKTSAHGMYTDRELVLDPALYSPDPNDDGYFYIGIVHFAQRNQLGISRYDEALLGISIGRPSPHAEQQVLNNTVAGMNTGDIYFEEDPVNGKVKFVTGGSCLLSVMWGWGYDDVAKFPAKHLELLAWLVGVNYYERLLAVYKTGTFRDQDFELNTDRLDKALENAKTKSEERLRAIELIPVTIG